MFFKKYQDHPFERVFTSSLKRSIESVDGFLNKGLPHTVLPGLNEINWGTREGTRITPEEDAYYRMVLKSWSQGKIDLRIEGGESPEDVAARQRPALDQIIQSPEKEILICMHGRAMRVLLCLMLNYPLRCMDLFTHYNLCLYQLTYSGSMFTIDSFCDTSHLISLGDNLD